MNYRSLATHNAACNEIFYRFQDCENEHPYRRFLGYCEHIQREMHECIKKQREIRRAESAQLRRKRLETGKPAQQETSD
ncbi:COX assembly mitochondrial protein 2 homolog [Temnothorax curvispinosus]|uniref:COX assembly mitochondrial protein n=1 Tax=Temnothorax curvispinosus TaxID=300111 RepID=A0A6J1R1R1_9HYME|nr:COX assembly mitochondrial protein 2 homolog [Temnothorax curvispinosus]XP_024893614.1 COX assembly mitochondrial protein 2 homolog [Temnothorax curvispinosus]